MIGIRKLDIGQRLIIGFSIILIITLFSTYSYVRSIYYTSDLVEKIYEHPLTVNSAVQQIRANILGMHRSMKDVALAENTEEMIMAEQLVNQYESEVCRLFNVVFDRFLGDKEDVHHAHELFVQWKPIREKVITYWNVGDKEAAINITKGIGAQHVEQIMESVNIMISFAEAKGESFHQDSIDYKNKAISRLVLFSFLLLLFSIFIVWVITRSITKPLNELMKVSRKIDKGDYSVRSNVDSNDELSEFGRVFNTMTDSIQSRSFILSAVSKLSRSLHGLEDEMEFAKTINEAFLELCSAQIVGFYRKVDEEFELVKAIGANDDIPKSFPKDNAPGEFHSAIYFKQMVVITDIPRNAVFKVQSIAGEMKPKSVLTLPIILDGRVEAVLGVASISHFKHELVEIVKQSENIINSSFSNITSNIKVKNFADDLVKVNEQLEYQSKILMEQTDELRMKSEELEQNSAELREQNIELEVQRTEVEQANQLKSEFLSNMSHELRTPLNSINALSKVMLESNSGNINAEETNYLQIIQRNGKRLLSLINDILDISKIEAGKMEVLCEPFNLVQSIESIVLGLNALANEKNIELKFEVEQKVSETISSDKRRVEQIITNIVGNAIKFTEEGFVKLTLAQSNQNFTIKVEDTGVGIDKHVLPHIFEEFRQEDGSTSRSFEGSGLGLAIVKKLLNTLNGTIEVESEKGRGSIFTITLPHCFGEESTELVSTEIQEQKSEPVENNNLILVVDDDRNVIKEISSFLRKQGYLTIGTTKGEEALYYAEQYKPFAITLDILMPDMDGWEVLSRLQKNLSTKDIPVIIVSSSNDMKTAVALGAIGYMQKPIDEEVLKNEMEKLYNPVNHVFILDDSESDRLYLKKLLVSNKVQVETFEKGDVCLEALKKTVPDLLILDLMMPNMDGFEVLSRIRKEEQLKMLPTIVVTAKDLTAEDKRRLSGNAISVLSKSDISLNSFSQDIFQIINHLKEKEKFQDEKQKSVLIVEDNEAAVIQIKNALKELSIKVNSVSNGLEAISFLKNSPVPNAIILDLMMPEMDGFEFVNRIRDEHKFHTIPVLTLSAKTLDKNELANLKQNNVYQVIQKGDVDKQELITTVSRMLSLPEKKPKDIHIRPSKIPIKPRTKNMPKILIVEDNDDNIVTVKAILGDQYSFSIAKDGETGLRKVIEEQPDLVLLDVSLPKKDGYQVIKEIRNDERLNTIFVVALTAKAMIGDREALIKAGCNDYVSKPIEAEVLRSVVEKFVKVKA